MIKLLKNTFFIIADFAILILFILWYITTCDYEPLIGIIATFVVLCSGISLKFLHRPRIELFQKIDGYGRNNLGISTNNPNIIRLGIDKPNIHWKLFWDFNIEMRNNSSVNAYSINFDYRNLPIKTHIENPIGKIEPILAHDKKEIKIKLIQEVESNSTVADKYLEENSKILMNNVKIIIKYKDENRITYYTEFIWNSNTNKFKLYNSKIA